MIEWLKGPGRPVALLGAATLVVVLMAAIAVISQRTSTSARFAPEPFFPGVEERVNEVSRLVLTDQEGTVTVAPDADGIWRVAEKDGYPAKFEKVKKTIVGLATLEKYEPRTTDPEWHRTLRLVSPENKGRAVRLEIFTPDSEEPLASILAGKVQDSDTEGRGTIYVRRDGEDRTWLARGSFSVETDPVEWLADGIVDIERDRLRFVRISPAEGPSYMLYRARPNQLDFMMADMPEGREIATQTIVNAVGSVPDRLDFDDVVLEEKAELEDAVVSTARYETFDGLVLDFTVHNAGTIFWMTAKASFDPLLAEAGAHLTEEPDSFLLNAEAVKEEVAAINARTNGWMYNLSGFRGRQLSKTLESLLRPLPGDGGNGQ